MKYKVGNKVKIKTWEGMREEYNSSHEGVILMGYFSFYKGMEDWINEYFSDRILTIKNIHVKEKYYVMVEMGWNWTDKMIKEGIFEPITNRFEIIDL